MRARLGDSVSGRYRLVENSLLTKHVVAAGSFAKDAGSTPAASTIFCWVLRYLLTLTGKKAGASARRGSRIDDPAAYHAEGMLCLPAEARFGHLLNRPEAENSGGMSLRENNLREPVPPFQGRDDSIGLLSEQGELS